MSHQFKPITSILILCIICLCTGCKGDESFVFNATDLIGTWESIEKDGTSIEPDEVKTYTFGSDGRLTIGRWVEAENNEKKWQENLYNYVCKRNEIVIANAYSRFVLQIYDLTNEVLKCKTIIYYNGYDDNNGDYALYIFKKKSDL